MANCCTPGFICRTKASPFDTGTLCRWWSQAPGPICVPPPLREWHNHSSIVGFGASTLKMSPEAVTLLKAIEELRCKPYDDQTGKDANVWVRGATIGYGHLIAKVDWETYKAGISKEQADALFRSDAEPFEKAVGEVIKVPVQQYEFDAMVILAFNIGADGFRNSMVAALINDSQRAGSETSLENAWKAFRVSQGVVNRGLINRRAAEWRIYTSGIYAQW